MNRHPAHISDALKMLHRSTQANEHNAPVLWLLVDPALHAPLTSVTDGLLQAIVSLPNLTEDLSPRLIQIDSERDSRILQRSIEIATQEISGEFDDDVHGRPRSMCAWLRPMAASNSLAASARLLANMAKLHPPGGEAPVSLRFWDPRITSDLIDLLSPAVWASHLTRCGISQWWHMDESMSLTPSVTEGSATLPRPVTLPWRPSEAQWHRLNQVSWRNRIQRLSQSWECASPPTSSAIDACVKRAVEAGLAHETDVICFVHACLTIDPDFDRHPAVQAALRGCKDTGEAGLFQAQSDAWQAALEMSAPRQIGLTP